MGMLHGNVMDVNHGRYPGVNFNIYYIDSWQRNYGKTMGKWSGPSWCEFFHESMSQGLPKTCLKLGCFMGILYQWIGLREKQQRYRKRRKKIFLGVATCSLLVWTGQKYIWLMSKVDKVVSKYLFRMRGCSMNGVEGQTYHQIDRRWLNHQGYTRKFTDQKPGTVTEYGTSEN